MSYTCTTCKAESNSTTTNNTTLVFYRLVPCNHIICADCYANPLTLIQCYGCTACGCIPSDKKTVAVVGRAPTFRTKEGEDMEGTHVEENTQEGEKQEEHNSTFCSSPYDLLNYGFTISGSNNKKQSCDFIPPPTKTTYTNCTQEPLYPTIPTKEETEEAKITIQQTFHYQPHRYYFSEEEETCSTTEDDDDQVTDSESDRSSCETSSEIEVTDSDEEEEEEDASPKKSSSSCTPAAVVVPKGCPDNKRPRRSPKPTHCEEHGKKLHKCKPCRRQYTFRARRLAREAHLEDKFIRGQKEELRKIWMTCYQ